MPLKPSFITKVFLFTVGLNLAIAPIAQAATNGALDRSTIYALGALLLVVLGLALYLAIVILRPEQF